MFIFLRLYLAHLIADFPLQTDHIYAMKVKSFKGVLLHSFIVTITMILLILPYINNIKIVLFILFIWVTHAIQDQLKILHSSKSKRGQHVFAYCFDQLFHLVFIASFFLFSTDQIQPNHYFSLNSLYQSKYYLSNQWILFFISIILATYASTYFIASFKQTFFIHWETPAYTYQDKYYGIIERLILLILIIFKPLGLLIFIPFAIFLKVIYANRQIKYYFKYTIQGFLMDSFLGLINCIFIGLFYQWILTYI